MASFRFFNYPEFSGPGQRRLTVPRHNVKIAVRDKLKFVPCLLIIILVFRPEGLLGERTPEGT